MQALLLKAVAVVSIFLNPSTEEYFILSYLSGIGSLIFFVDLQGISYMQKAALNLNYI